MILSLGYPKSKPEKIPKLMRRVIVHNNEYHEKTDEEVKKAFDDKYEDFGGDPKEYLAHSNLKCDRNIQEKLTWSPEGK